jgi:hypothetical protein
VSSNEDYLVFGALIFAALLVAIRALDLKGKPGYKLNDSMGPANWDFSKSWASTLTIVGAVLGTILSASGVVPATTKYLTHGSYAALNLLFGIVVVLAPFVYRALGRSTRVLATSPAAEVNYEGTVLGFFVAVFLTLWGVIGELATSCLIFAEVQISQTVLDLFLAILVVSGGLLLVYVWRSCGWVVRDQREHREDRAQRRAALANQITAQGLTLHPTADAPLPTWSVL